MEYSDQFKKNFLIIVFVVAALAVGYYFGAQAEKTKAAESRAALVKEIFDPAVSSVSNVFGKIIEISSDKKSFIVESSGVFQVNLPAEYRRKRIVITPETTFVLYEQKAPDLFAMETEEYRKKQTTAKNGLSLNRPIPVIEKEISSDGLRVGDMAGVIFAPESGKNFLDSEFTAVSISVNR